MTEKELVIHQIVLTEIAYNKEHDDIVVGEWMKKYNISEDEILSVRESILQKRKDELIQESEEFIKETMTTIQAVLGNNVLTQQEIQEASLKMDSDIANNKMALKESTDRITYLISSKPEWQQ